MGMFGTWTRGGMAAVAAASVIAGCAPSVNTIPENEQAVAAVAPDDENTAALRERASAFGDLLQGMRTMSKEEACYELQYFIAPGPKLREQVLGYYGEFNAAAEKFAIVSQSVTNVSVDASGNTARVTFRMVAEAPGGAKIPAEQVTDWRKVEGNWYRTMADPEKRLGR